MYEDHIKDYIKCITYALIKLKTEQSSVKSIHVDSYQL